MMHCDRLSKQGGGGPADRREEGPCLHELYMTLPIAKAFTPSLFWAGLHRHCYRSLHASKVELERGVVSYRRQ